jgi:hypothetical protein
MSPTGNPAGLNPDRKATPMNATNLGEFGFREVLADELRAVGGGDGAQSRSDLGQQLQLALQEANNIYTRISSNRPAPSTNINMSR